MIAPHVNLNGTSRQALFDAYLKTAEALREARLRLEETAPHGRDYPDPVSLSRAQWEYRSRWHKVMSVYDDMTTLAAMLADDITELPPKAVV